MKKYVISFILKCEQCRKNKYDIYKIYGAPQKIKPAIKKWQLIIINFIIKLPKLRDPIIEIVINRFIKK